MVQQLRVTDELALFHDSIITAWWSTGTTASAAIDLGAADVDEESPGEVVVNLAGMTSGGSATVNVQVFDCDTVGGTYAIITPQAVQTGALDFDDATWAENGGLLRLALPAYGLRQFVKVNLVVAVANLTAGVATVWFARTPK